MSVLEFISESPWLSFFFAILLRFTFHELFFLVCRTEHCDADGDFKKEDVNANSQNL